MDHEYDAQVEDDRTEKTVTGLDSPPNGPSAAHFREAARLAAARARKALERDEERNDPQPPAKTTAVVADDFKTAAGKHARSMSGRGKIADMKKSRAATEKTAAPTAEERRDVDESIGMLDERLHLGARMLRAFESQIERLEEAGATAVSETTTPNDAARIEEACTRLEEALTRAARVEKTLSTLIARAENIAAGLGNGIEICNAIQAGTQDRAREIAELENAQQQRSDALIERTQAVLTRMERTLRATEALDAPRPEEADRPTTPIAKVIQEPPVIEIHARTPLSESVAQGDTTGRARDDVSKSGEIAAHPDTETLEAAEELTGEQFSLGTLSVEPGRAHRPTQSP